MDESKNKKEYDPACCVAETVSGSQCRRKVAVPGTRCQHHLRSASKSPETQRPVVLMADPMTIVPHEAN